MFFGGRSVHWPCGDRVLMTCSSVLDGCWYGTKTKHSPWFDVKIAYNHKCIFKNHRKKKTETDKAKTTTTLFNSQCLQIKQHLFLHLTISTGCRRNLTVTKYDSSFSYLFFRQALRSFGFLETEHMISLCLSISRLTITAHMTSSSSLSECLIGR